MAAPAPKLPEGPPRENPTSWARWTGAGLEFGVAVLVFFFLGSWLDARWGTQPWMTVAGSTLGVVCGTYLLVKQALESERAERERRSGPPPRN